jgi:hypothetical protein
MRTRSYFTCSKLNTKLFSTVRFYELMQQKYTQAAGERWLEVQLQVRQKWLYGIRSDDQYGIALISSFEVTT